ncbi:hypothetical protein SEA_YAGO84_46 [Gordonia phage Yago84]|nr:hypothetical protein SEA_YAGO84_46 [Gordonia phage Yago84]QIG58974.1 hypothetical protein SEA_ANCLAR_47 [Gordonia phage AnClar]WIC90028.1 hypothetical protein SEA_SISKO_46 [Gordonia phage Sisko]
MQFARTDLIATITTILEADDVARAERQRKIKNLYDEHAASWDDSNWRAFRDRITALLKTGKPIRYNDLRGSWSRGDWEREFAPAQWATAEESDAVRRKVRIIEDNHRVLGDTRRGDLEAIRATLEKVLDEVITDAQLGRLGFGAKSIGQVFRAAVTVK